MDIYSGPVQLCRKLKASPSPYIQLLLFDLDDQLILIKMPSPEHSTAISAVDDASSVGFKGFIPAVTCPLVLSENNGASEVILYHYSCSA